METRSAPLLQTILANQFINASNETPVLDELYYVSLRFVRAFPQADVPHGSLLRQFASCAQIARFPEALITQNLYPAFMQRSADIQAIAKALPAGVLSVNYALDKEYKIDVQATIKQWLSEYLQENLENLNDDDLSVSLEQLFASALKFGDLAHCQLIWNHTSPSVKAQKLNFKSLKPLFIEFCAGNRLDRCQWLWGVASHDDKETLLQDITEYELTYTYVYKTLSAIVKGAELTSIVWLKNCCREMKIEECNVMFPVIESCITNDAKPEILQALWDSAEEVVKIRVMEQFTSHYFYKIKEWIINDKQELVEWCKQNFNDDLGESIIVEQEKLIELVIHALSNRNIAACKRFWDQADAEARKAIATGISYPYLYSPICDEFFEHIKIDSSELHTLLMNQLFNLSNFSSGFNSGMRKSCEYVYKVQADDNKRAELKAKLLKRYKFDSLSAHGHFAMLQWLYSVCNEAEQGVLLSKCDLYRLDYSPDMQCWFWEKSKTSKLISASRMFYYLVKKDFLEDAKSIYETLSDDEKVEARCKINPLDFHTALANRQLDVCEWIWEVSTNEERNRLREEYPYGRHMNLWLYRHAENNKQRLCLMQADCFTEMRQALELGHFAACKAMWQACATKCDQDSMLRSIASAFPRALLKGHLSIAKWLWTCADQSQRTALLKRVSLQHVVTINHRRRSDISVWLMQLLSVNNASTLQQVSMFTNTVAQTQSTAAIHQRRSSM